MDQQELFTQYCKQVLQREQYDDVLASGQPDKFGRSDKERRFDFLVTGLLRKRRVRCGVEIVYQSHRPNLVQLSEICRRLKELAQAFRLDKGILAINWPIRDSAANAIASELGVDLWDSVKLAATLPPFKGIELNLPYAQERPPDQEAVYFANADELARYLSVDQELNLGVVTGISALLNRTPSGKKKSAAIMYERICKSILFLLFAPDLRGFLEQNTTVDRINRFDVVCSIAANEDFWARMASDFRTRTVLFECKNYSDPIRPHEVFTTERYLSSKALRTVAFLLSRKGWTTQCEVAAHGALREGGKLLVCLSDKDLMTMLQAKVEDSSSKAHLNYLEDKVFSVLTAAGR